MLLACLWALAVTACAPQQERPVPPTPARPPGFPEAFYKAASAKGEPVFAIESPDSQRLEIRVYRAGSLASLGHDHVVSARDVHGYALIPRDRSLARVDVYLPVDSMVVDRPGAGAEAADASDLSQQDIDATRRHMLEDVLASARYPFVVIHGVCRKGAPLCATLDAGITLHGVTRTVAIPIRLELGSGRLLVSGHFSVLQSDFGMTPYSILGGALRVKDRIDVKFGFEASRINSGR
ncbi:MAG: YceI family protein [Burkholderiales bacterium]